LVLPTIKFISSKLAYLNSMDDWDGLEFLSETVILNLKSGRSILPISQNLAIFDSIHFCLFVISVKSGATVIKVLENCYSMVSDMLSS
jgi:hypothetical protein